ncbi:MAG: type II secretion system F family protein, partial [Candidatus Komeilibacteria bacterium]|nr:type II secretion system F family protein [Candidatus Komeilibacteria bacterium]
MSPEEIKLNSLPAATKPNLTAETNASTAENESFVKLEKKFLEPAGINDKFDIWLDTVRSIPNEEKIFFTQNLGVMYSSGLSGARALRTLALQTTHHKFKRALLRIYRQVERGTSLAVSMRL